MRNILGLSCFYHDSAAALIQDGKVLAAAQEERFSRKKHDSSFPESSIDFCLNRAGIKSEDLDSVVFYEKPLLHLDRLIETYIASSPKGFKAFRVGLHAWLTEKLNVERRIRKGLGNKTLDVFFTEHHEAHVASAFFPSPFDSAAILTVDGVGEWATTTIAKGSDSSIEPISEIHFPHSLGLLYSAFTYYAGFRVNSGEYKLMGLAPYGEPLYVEKIFDNLIEIIDDGSFRLNLDYFEYCKDLKMIGSSFETLFDGPARKPESELTIKDMNIASSIQSVIETVVLSLGRRAFDITGEKSLCMSGGVALNCVANGKLLRDGPFENIWVQPASGDAGSAVGAALSVWNQNYGSKKKIQNKTQIQNASLLGPEFNKEEVMVELDAFGAKYQEFSENEIVERVARILSDGKIVGWFQNRMEFGPRALGNRSILGDPRNEEMQRNMNLKIKYRESFRPFAPSVLSEKVEEYFEIKSESPYMLFVAPVNRERVKLMSGEENDLFGIDKLNISRSDIPAVTHVDYSARVQTVSSETNPLFHSLLSAFEKLTGCAVLVNTSFNVRGEPIVCNPSDAYRCFMRTKMDYLVIGNLFMEKALQGNYEESEEWETQYVLD